jgi:hypothetical protein
MIIIIWIGILFADKKLEQKALVDELLTKLPKPVEIKPAPDLTKVENTVNNISKTLQKWESWNPEGVCSIDSIGCPTELKDIYKKYDLISRVPQDCLKRANQLLLARLEFFNSQIDNIEKGQWQLVVRDGDLLTDADLTYDIITEKILAPEANIVIKASTILPYIEWWLSSIGLKYLEKQRNFNVERVFLFPDKVYPLIFKDIKLEPFDYQSAMNYLAIEYPSYRLKDKLIRAVLYMHYCLKINVLLLSPSMVRSKQIPPKNHNIIDEWQKKDTVIIQKRNGDLGLSNICSIQIKTFPQTIGKYLVADEGNVFFGNEYIDKEILSSYNVISENAISLSTLIKDKFAFFEKELLEIAKILEYDLDKQSRYGNTPLTDEKIKNSINNYIFN